MFFRAPRVGAGVGTCPGRGAWVCRAGSALLSLQPRLCPAARGGLRRPPELPRSLRPEDALQPHASSVLRERLCTGWDIPQTK